MNSSGNSQTGPLKGIRVIEMAAMGPVPFCGMMLADLGAEVICIDRANAPPMGEPIAPEFDFMSRGRRSISLDLKNSKSVDIVLKLVATADVLMEGMRPGAMERLGLGPDECFASNEKLIYGRMTGWGQSGPLAQQAGHDINYISLNGVLDSIGSKNGPPVPPVNLIGDYGGGSMFLMAGILSALIETSRSGKGQVVDAAMIDGSSYLMSTIHMFYAAGMWQAKRGSNFLDGGAPFYGVYETRDNQFMAVGSIEPKFYAALLEGLDLNASELPDPQNPGNWEQLRTTFAAVFKSKTKAEWTTVFSGLDACVTPVLSVEESLLHPHNRERNSFLDMSGTHRPNLAPRFGRTSGNAGSKTSLPGEQGRDILIELEFTEQQINDLVQQNIAVIPGE